jgi:hypothetical protein
MEELTNAQAPMENIQEQNEAVSQNFSPKKVTREKPKRKTKSRNVQKKSK